MKTLDVEQKEITVKVGDESIITSTSNFTSGDDVYFSFKVISSGQTTVTFTTANGYSITSNVTVPPVKAIESIKFRESELVLALSEYNAYVDWDYSPIDANDPDVSKIVVKNSDISVIALAFSSNTADEYIANYKYASVYPKAVGTTTLTVEVQKVDGVILSDVMTVTVTDASSTTTQTKTVKKTLARKAPIGEELIIFEQQLD